MAMFEATAEEEEEEEVEEEGRGVGWWSCVRAERKERPPVLRVCVCVRERERAS